MKEMAANGALAQHAAAQQDTPGLSHKRHSSVASSQSRSSTTMRDYIHGTRRSSIEAKKKLVLSKGVADKE